MPDDWMPITTRADLDAAVARPRRPVDSRGAASIVRRHGGTEREARRYRSSDPCSSPSASSWPRTLKASTKACSNRMARSRLAAGQCRPRGHNTPCVWGRPVLWASGPGACDHGYSVDLASGDAANASYRRVAGLVDLPHASGADQAEDFVGAQPRARSQGHGRSWRALYAAPCLFCSGRENLGRVPEGCRSGVALDSVYKDDSHIPPPARCPVSPLRLGVAFLTRRLVSISVSTIDNPANTPILAVTTLNSATRRQGKFALMRRHDRRRGVSRDPSGSRGQGWPLLDAVPSSGSKCSRNSR